MALKDDLLSDLDVFFDEDDFAEEITYIAQADQNSYVISAIVDYHEDPDFVGNGVAEYAEIAIKKTDVPEIRNQDTVLIGTKYWTVEKHVSAAGSVARVLIRRKEGARVK